MLVTVTLCSAKAIKVAFGSLNLPDQFRLGLAEGTNAISLAYIPDFLHFHFGPLFDLQPNDPKLSPNRVRLLHRTLPPKSSSASDPLRAQPHERILKVRHQKKRRHKMATAQEFSDDEPYVLLS